MKITQGDHILYENSSYSSPFFCRPIRLYMKKESISFIQNVFGEIKSEIDALKQFDFDFLDKIFRIETTFFPSMNDGKVVNSLENIRNTKMCFLCKKSGKEMQGMHPEYNFYVALEVLIYGLQPLHLLIRCAEWVLKIAYHQNCEGLSRVDKKVAVEAKRKAIFDQIFRAFGFRVDIPSIRNGRSTDGFMARKLFSKHEIFARILELDPSFVKNLSILLAIVSSSKKFDSNKVLGLCKEVFEFFQNSYSSRINITPTIHKLLCHSHQFIERIEFPPGVLTEQSVELSHKYTKKFKKLSFSNKRENILRDTFNRFFVLTSPSFSLSCSQINKVSDICLVDDAILDSYT